MIYLFHLLLLLFVVASVVIQQPKKRLTTREAAEYLGVAEQTLVVWRSTKQDGRRIPYYKIGGKVTYDVADLEEFLASRKVTA